MSTHIQRDHLFNRSTRPLLESKSHHHHSPLKKKSTKEFKVHGFNDFNFVANQYKNLNSNISYPYGSGSPPPSPPIHSSIMHQQSNQDMLHAYTPYDNCNSNINANNKIDLIFSDDSGIHVNNISDLSTSSTNYYDDIDNSYQLASPIASSSIGGNDGTTDAWCWNLSMDTNNERRTPTTIPNDQQGPNQSHAQPPQQQRFNQLDDSGPFIFGVHTNNCNSFNNTTASTTTKTNERNESVINNTLYSTKYSSIVTKRTPDSSAVSI